MNRRFTRSLTAIAVTAALAVPTIASATNGYFKIGYGTKARTMGGVGIALPQDALAPATNPAGLSFLETNRIDAGVEFFRPLREGRVDARNFGGTDTGEVESGASLYAIPNMGFAMRMGDMSVGMSIAANGGMNTRYNSNLYANAFTNAIIAFNGAMPGFFAGYSLTNGQIATALSQADLDTLGVNLAQVLIQPTVSYKINDNHAVGASLIIGYQQFRAYGLGLFSGFSTDNTKLTGNGNDNSLGYGLRVGWTGKIGDRVMVGATAASKVYMQKFKDYAGLFAGQGEFDIPANIGLGVSFKATDDVTLALDVVRIYYEGVDAIANKGPTAAQFVNDFTAFLCNTDNQFNGTGSTCPALSAALGSDNGYGFGWENVTVVKFGASYRHDDQWTFNFGYNHNTQTYDNSETFFNVIAPGLVQNHLTLGAVYAPSAYTEITFGYMRAFQEDQSYTYDAGANGNFTTYNGMDQHSFEISYGMKF